MKSSGTELTHRGTYMLPTSRNDYLIQAGPNYSIRGPDVGQSGTEENVYIVLVFNYVHLRLAHTLVRGWIIRTYCYTPLVLGQTCKYTVSTRPL